MDDRVYLTFFSRKSQYWLYSLYTRRKRRRQHARSIALGIPVASFLRSHTAGAFDQYLRDIQKLPLIPYVAEEKALARRALPATRLAAERLVTANLRFVISYVKRYQGHGLDLSELARSAMKGCLKAVQKFDPEHGVKFISYAVWWVRQAVLKALAEQTRSVRIASTRIPL